MNIFHYFQEVRDWGKKLLQLLYKREGDLAEREQLIQRVEDLLARIENEWELNEVLAEEVSVTVDEIQQEATALLQEPLFQADEGRVAIGKHVLPPLPYPYNGLEPYISKEIMVLHHSVHHQSYVDGLNKAEIALQEARLKNDYHFIKHWSREAAFHGSGHYLHTIFWNNMSREGGRMPNGVLLQQIQKDFGNFEKFKKHFAEAATQVEGVGWAILFWSPRAQHLDILQTEKHQLFAQWDTIPLLVLDMWEHAYYLQYKTKKAEYVKQWWNIVNWKYVEKRFEKASALKWQTY